MDKDKMLKIIQKNRKGYFPLPKSYNAQKKGINAPDFFKQMLQDVGGVCFEVNGRKEFDEHIISHFSGAIDFMRKESWDKYPPECPNEKLFDLKTIVLEGQFGVAENGAIWIDDSNFPNRLVPFVCEELIICLDEKNILEDMHEAYNKIINNKVGFGVFISGPSKTADIEQNLVLGAQASKRLIVFLIK